MKKKPFMIVCIALIMGAFCGICTHMVIETQAEAFLVKAEEMQSSVDEVVSEEEKSNLQKIIDELTAKYNQIKDIQVAGTTIGAIAGAIVGAIVSAVPAIINRSNIKKAIESVDACKQNVAKVNDVLSVVKEKFGIANENYEKAIEVINMLSEELKTVKASLEQAEENYVALKQDNVALQHDNEKLRDIIVLMVNHTKEYVANGTAEYVNSLFKK